MRIWFYRDEDGAVTMTLVRPIWDGEGWMIPARGFGYYTLDLDSRSGKLSEELHLQLTGKPVPPHPLLAHVGIEGGRVVYYGFAQQLSEQDQLSIPSAPETEEAGDAPQQD